VSPDDVRALARSAHARWTGLELRHRSRSGTVEATLRHGELDAVDLSTGRVIRERGAPPSSWTVRPLEPYATSYQWSAMLDPHELGEGVAISEVRREERFGRPVVVFEARAGDGYDPVCSCCPLVFSLASERLEHDDDWEPPADLLLPDHVELALDLEVGIVVDSEDVGGFAASYRNEIVRVER
jgi:hypothetical protein